MKYSRKKTIFTTNTKKYANNNPKRVDIFLKTIKLLNHINLIGKIKMKKINENDAKLIAFIINDWVERVTDDEDHINVVDRFNNDAKRREMIHGTVWDQSFLYDSNDNIRKGNYYDALYQQLDGLLTIIKADKLRAKLYEANLIDDSSDYYKSCIENIRECYQDNLEEINECLDHVEKHEKQIIEKWEEKKSNEKDKDVVIISRGVDK